MTLDFGPDQLQEAVCLAQILTVSAVALDEIGNRVQSKPIDAEIEPELQDLFDLANDARIVEIEVGLAGVEPVPVIGLRYRIPAPVRHFGIEKDDARFLEFIASVAPHVIVALRGTARCVAGALKPGVLVRAVVDDQLDNNADAARMRRRDKLAKIVERAVSRIDRLVIRDVVAVIAQRRFIKRQQPDCVDAEILDVV